GTHNKVTDYFKQPFSELYGLVTRLLREQGRVECLLMAGYGGADKGVNLQVSDWMQTGTDRRLVLIHPDPPGWVRHARPHLASQWPARKAAGRISEIPSRFEDLNTEEWLSACRPPSIGVRRPTGRQREALRPGDPS